MANEGLVNCKKCGTLFFKNSEREICEECFKKECLEIDKIREFIDSTGKDKITPDEICGAMNLDKNYFNELLSRGKLLKILPKLSMKCRFCGAELENDEKTSFTCKKCTLKFSPKANQLKEKGINLIKHQEEARNIQRRLRGGISSLDTSSRYGFVQNYTL